MRSGTLNSVAVLVATTLLASSASAQNPFAPPTDLGDITMTGAMANFAFFDGTTDADPNAYQVGTTLQLGTYDAAAVAFQFSLAMPADVAIQETIPDTTGGGVEYFLFALDNDGTPFTIGGTADPIIQVDTTTFPGFALAIAASARLTGSGTFDIDGLPVPAGNWLIVADVFTGPPGASDPGANGLGEVLFNINVTPQPADATECGGDPATLAVTDLDATVQGNADMVFDAGESSGSLSGETGNGSAVLCLYSTSDNADGDAANDPFSGFYSDLGEVVYRFTTSEETRIRMTNNIGVALRTDLDYYLVAEDPDNAGMLEAAAMQDVFVSGVGPTNSTVAFNALGFLDEEGSFGVLPAGTYFFVVDAFDDPFGAFNGGDGSFDVTLDFEAPVETCGTDGTGGPLAFDDQTTDAGGAGMDVEYNPGSAPLTVSVSAGDPLFASNICFYTTGGLDNFPVALDRPLALGDEYIVRLVTDAPTAFSVEFAGDTDAHDLYLVRGIDIANDLVLRTATDMGEPLPLVDVNGDGSLLATVNTSTAGFTDLAGADTAPVPVGVTDLGSGQFTQPAYPAGEYFFIVERNEAGAGEAFDLTITFEAGTAVPSPVVDPATEGTDLGEVAVAGEPFTISFCDGAAGQDTEIALFDDTGSLVPFGGSVAVNDNGCGEAGGPSRLENLTLNAGTYHLVVAGFNTSFSSGFMADVTFASVPVGESATPGSTFAINGMAVGFDAPAQQRDVFTFSVGANDATMLPAGVTVQEDLGDAALDGDNILISLCGSDFDTELALFDTATGDLIETNDDSATCGDDRSAIFLSRDDTAEGQSFTVVVGGKGTVFADGFFAKVDGLDDDGMTDAGTVALSIDTEDPDTMMGTTTTPTPATFALSSNTFAYFTFTIGAPTPMGCNEADLAEPFDILNSSDVNAFVGAFLARDPAADLAEPLTIFNSSDINIFVGAFLNGCRNPVVIP